MSDEPRHGLLRRAFRLEALTVGWNIVEGVVAVAAGAVAASVALVAFGIDSFIETASAVVVGWRLLDELRHRSAERAERASGAMKQVLGADVVPRPSTMGGDDFAIYGAQEPRIPSFMFRLGTVSAEAVARSEQGETLPSLHSPQFLPDREPSIRAGVLAMSAAVVELLRR